MAGYIGNFPTAVPLSGADIQDGTITNSDLANSSITVNGTSISLGASGSISAGITEADQWRITSSTTHGTNYLTSNWERNDTSFSKIGTGMTQSSGVFTFPSTGIYHVSWVLSFYLGNNTFANSTGGYIGFTTNNSTYDDVTDNYNCIFQDSGNVFSSVSMHVILDITDTSNQKVKFASSSTSIDVITNGATDKSKTHATFIRLGDT